MEAVLLDTNALIWLYEKPELLSPKVTTVLQTPRLKRWVGWGVFWEISIKQKKGTLPISVPIEALYKWTQQIGFEVLAPDVQDVFFLDKLPAIHQDPFDRLLIAQALRLNLPIITSDKIIPLYPVSVIW